MTRRFWLAGGSTLTAGLLLITMNAGLAGAADRPTARSAATTTAARQQVIQYWTPERMRQATPLERLVTTRTGKPATAAQVAAGKPVTFGATAPVAPQSIPNTGGPWTGGGAVTRTAGRVFFSNKADGFGLGLVLSDATLAAMGGELRLNPRSVRGVSAEARIPISALVAGVP